MSCTSASKAFIFAVRFQEVISNSKSRKQTKQRVEYAVKLAGQHTGTVGCRSLDILHCAAAKVLAATEFISTDSRQKKLATAMGLNLVVI